MKYFQEYHQLFRHVAGSSSFLLDHRGFAFHRRRGQVQQITKDWLEFLALLEYDVERWNQGFENEEALLAFVRSSPYFSGVYHTNRGAHPALCTPQLPSKKLTRTVVKEFLAQRKTTKAPAYVTDMVIPFEEAKGMLSGTTFTTPCGKHSLSLSSRALTFFFKEHICTGCKTPIANVAIQKHRSTSGDKWHLNAYTEGGVLMTSDHIHPRSKGGSNGLRNRQTMCQPCNLAKADSLPAGV